MRKLIGLVAMLVCASAGANEYDIPVPNGYNAVGAWVPISDSGIERTFVFGGGLSDVVVVEILAPDAAATGVPIARIAGPSAEQNINFYATAIRARRKAGTAAVTLKLRSPPASVVNTPVEVSSVYKVPGAASAYLDNGNPVTVAYAGCPTCTVMLEGTVNGSWVTVGRLTGNTSKNIRAGFTSLRSVRQSGPYSADEALAIYSDNIASRSPSYLAYGDGTGKSLALEADGFTLTIPGANGARLSSAASGAQFDFGSALNVFQIGLTEPDGAVAMTHSGVGRPYFQSTSTFPLTLTQGVILGSGLAPDQGISMSWRVKHTVDLASIAANVCAPDQSVAVVGMRADADCIANGPAALPASLVVTCFTDANAVKLRICNNSIAAVDPPSLTYSMRVFVPYPLPPAP